jgi:hypothetical protein
VVGVSEAKRISRPRIRQAPTDLIDRVVALRSATMCSASGCGTLPDDLCRPVRLPAQAPILTVPAG